MFATARVPCRNQRPSTVAACVIAISLFALSGCNSTRSGSGAQTGGAAANVSTALGPSARAAARQAAKDDVDPGYQRYLVRLAQRRQARGLAAPAELRVAQRRERYKNVFAVLSKGAVDAVKEATNPITRRIPYVGPSNDPIITNVAGFPGEMADQVDQTTKLAAGQLFRQLDQ